MAPGAPDGNRAEAVAEASRLLAACQGPESQALVSLRPLR